MPAEWAPHLRTWIEWPCRDETFSGQIDLARDAYAAVAQAIAAFEPVTIITLPENVASVSLRCGNGVGILSLPHDDAWMRDNGPSFLTREDGLVAGVAWRWNAWGRLYERYERDASVAHDLLEYLQFPIFEAPLVMEGGAFHTDGAGTLLVTEQCLLNPNRNPEMSRAEIELALKRYLGVIKVIWLGQGLIGDETGGHIDNIACFVAPGRVLLHTVKDPDDPNYKIMADNRVRLEEASDANDRQLEILELEAPATLSSIKNQNNVRSYVNFYLCNGAAILPSFEDSADRKAIETLAKAFPDRRLVQIPALDIVAGGGGIHCMTKQQPNPVGL